MEKTGDLGRRLTVELPSEEIDSKVSGRLNELRGQVRLKGFRPGKVPLNVVRQRYGAQVRQEVLQEAMQKALQEAITEQELRVAGVSSLAPEDEAGGKTFRFTAEVEVFPEMPAVDVSDLELERPVVEITEEDVDNMIGTLREQRRSWSDAGRAAAEGDRVTLEFHAEVDGKRVPGSGERKLKPVLGSGVLFEAFEELVSGRAAGESGQGEIAFPDDYDDDEMAGQTAKVEFSVQAVEASSMPEADDAFAESFGIEGGIEQMRVDVRRNLEREMRAARSNRLKQHVTDKLAERYADFSLPAAAVRQEIVQMQGQLRQQFGEQVSLPEDQLRLGAEKRVRLGFLMAEIARQSEMQVDSARVDARIADIADTYENPSEVIELYRQNQQLLGQIENSVLEEQVVDWVLENASVQDRAMKFKELMDES